MLYYPIFYYFYYLQARSIPWLPQVLLGILSIVAGLVALLLPETRWHSLPDTIAEIEGWSKKKKKPTEEEADSHTPRALLRKQSVDYEIDGEALYNARESVI